LHVPDSGVPAVSNEQISAAVTAQSAKVTALAAQVAAAETTITDLRSRNKSVNAEILFTKDLYDKASTRAVEEVALNRTLSEKLKIKDSQLSNGLKQKDMHSAAVRARDQQLIATLRAQNKVLLDQARRTDDTVRARAVLYPQVKAENERLLQTHRGLEDRVEALGKRNETLLDQVTALRARRMGVFDEEDSGSSYSGSDRDTWSDSGSYTDDDGQDMAGMGYATGPPGRESSSAARSQQARDEDDVEVKVEEADDAGEEQCEGYGEENDGPGMAFECQVRGQKSQGDGDTVCGLLLENRGVSLGDLYMEDWAVLIVSLGLAGSLGGRSPRGVPALVTVRCRAYMYIQSYGSAVVWLGRPIRAGRIFLVGFVSKAFYRRMHVEARKRM
jgi:hypothetical protein